MIPLWSIILVAACMLLFFAVNLHNVLRYHRTPTPSVGKPEVPRPQGLILGLVALGTGVFFFESLVYVFLGILNSGLLRLGFFDLPMMRLDLLEFAGVSIMVIGYAIFIWSVLARGRYATSWTMPIEQQLVDWGPYRYVRHPSYLGYFLMFAGFFLMWHNILALIPLVALPGYVLVTVDEEEMLMRRFGERYLQYRKRTGRFFPKMRLRRGE